MRVASTRAWKRDPRREVCFNLDRLYACSNGKQVPGVHSEGRKRGLFPVDSVINIVKACDHPTSYAMHRAKGGLCCVCFLYIARRSESCTSRLSATARSFSCCVAETVDHLIMWLRVECGPGRESSYIWAKVLPDISSSKSHPHLQSRPRDEAYPRLLLLSDLPSRCGAGKSTASPSRYSLAPRYTAICHELVTSLSPVSSNANAPSQAESQPAEQSPSAAISPAASILYVRPHTAHSRA